MLIQIKRTCCLDKYKQFPQTNYNRATDEADYFYPKIYANHVFTLRSKSFKGHIKLLGTELTILLKNMGFNSLIFLGDTETAWRYQHNDYNPVKNALTFLKEQKVGKRFNGALQVDTTQLPEFIQHLSWLTRCNASLPYIYFSDNEQHIIGNICKYGNVHFDTLNRQTDASLKKIIINSKFEYLNDQICYNQFAKSSAIKGRKIIV